MSNLGKYFVTYSMIKIKTKSLIEMQSIDPQHIVLKKWLWKTISAREGREEQIMQNKMVEINLIISIIKVNINGKGYNI